MIKLSYSKQSLKATKKLPKNQKTKLSKLLIIFQIQPFSSQLHSKPLKGQLTGFYSFRIIREWRVIFKFLDPASIISVDVTHRKDIYR